MTLAGSDLRTRDYSASAIRRCLTEILAHFPVYRIYARVGSTSRSDKDYLGEAVESRGSQLLAGRSLARTDTWRVAFRPKQISAGLESSRMCAGAFSATKCTALRESCRRHRLLPLRQAYLT